MRHGKIKKRRRQKLFAVALFSVSPIATASGQTSTYSYDALGRLVATTTSGGANAQPTASTYDQAGNRTGHVVGSAATNPTPTPTPSTPVAVNDQISLRCNQSAVVDLVANDSDPGGNYPLVLLSIDQGPGSMDGYAQIASATSVDVVAGPSIGTFQTYDYVVRNSLGATTMGHLNVYTTGPSRFCS